MQNVTTILKSILGRTLVSQWPKKDFGATFQDCWRR